MLPAKCFAVLTPRTVPFHVKAHNVKASEASNCARYHAQRIGNGLGSNRMAQSLRAGRRRDDVGEDAHPPAKRHRGDSNVHVETVHGNAVHRDRKRAGQACDQCRAKKNKCDGGRPICRSCALGRLECVYDTKKKRGLQAGYVHTLESLLGLIFEVIPNSEEAALRLLRSSYLRYDEEEKLAFDSTLLHGCKSTRAVWSNSFARAEIGRAVSKFENNDQSVLRSMRPSANSPSASATVESAENTAFEPWAVSNILPTGVATFSPTGSERMPTVGVEAFRSRVSDIQTRTVFDPSQSFEDPEHRRDYSDTLSARRHENVTPQIITTMDVPADSWFLLDVYFKYVSSWLPFIPRYVLLRSLSSQQDGIGPPSDEPALLWAVFALSSVLQEREPNCPGSSISDQYYRLALDSMPVDCKAYGLAHIQSAIILAMVLMARSHWEQASILLGRGIRSLLLLRKNSSASEETSSLEVQGSSAYSYVYLASFALDTIIAAHMNTLPHLRTQDIKRYMRFDLDKSEEWEQWSPDRTIPNNGALHPHLPRPLRSLSTFKEYITMMAVFNEILCDAQGEDLSKAKLTQLWEDLQTWYTKLPRHCVLSTPISTPHEYPEIPDLLPPVANLHFTLEAVMSFMNSLPQWGVNANLQTQTASSASIGSFRKRIYQQAFGPYQYQGILKFHEQITRKTNSE